MKMIKLIKADLFRLTKGSAVRNVLIAGIAIILFTGITMYNSGSGLFSFGVRSSVSVGSSVPATGADFVRQMRDDGFFPFFILAFAVAILGADYSAGTIRNTLSYFTGRKSVYTAKCITGLLCCLVYSVVCLVVSMLLGVILFGFKGFSTLYFGRLLGQIVLSLPLFLGMIGIGYCLLVFTRRSSITIAAYIVGMLFFPSLTYSLYQIFPSAKWLQICDPLSAFSVVSRFWEFPPLMVALMILTWLAIDAAVISIGMHRYETVDVA